MISVLAGIAVSFFLSEGALLAIKVGNYFSFKEEICTEN